MIKLPKPNKLKAERVQFEFLTLDGWDLIEEWNPVLRENVPTGFWTAWELADHLEACELVPELGKLADTHCSTPDITVRGRYVFVTCGNAKDGIVEEDFDFARAVDREIGTGQRQQSLLDR